MPAIPTKIFLEKLQKQYGDEICHLTWDKNKPWTLLFAVILSAQCTDARVNKVTPLLFKEFPDLESFAARPIEDIERAVKSTGFFRNKALSLQESAKRILLKQIKRP